MIAFINSLMLLFKYNFEQNMHIKYKEMEEVRFIYTESSDVEIFIADSIVDYKLIGNVIDLDNYYPLSSIKIKSSDNLDIRISDELNFNSSYFAYYSGDKNIITIDDWIFYKPKWRVIKSNRLLKENRCLLKIV